MAHGDHIAAAAIAQYHQLAAGRAHLRQTWTVLAAVVVARDGGLSVLALATGVKCLPQSAVAQHPLDLVHDSHAEILARRAVLVYLARGGCRPDGRLDALLSGARLYLYVSQSPCGEASVSFIEHSEECPLPADQVLHGHAYPRDPCRRLRTKPGRKDSPPTESHCCSDKIALWTALGLQGALLSERGRVYLDGVVIGGRLDEEAAQSAFNGRLAGLVLPSGRRIVPLEIRGCTHVFPRSQLALPGTEPDPTAMAWHRDMAAPEWTVDGRRQGSKGPDRHFPASARSMLAPSSLFSLLQPVDGDYIQTKLRAAEYQRDKQAVLSRFGQRWLVSKAAMAGRVHGRPPTEGSRPG